MPAATLEYRPPLDGLRGLAVAAVIAYHLGFPWARGGFLGVDVFLVVSGYLITALLLAEREADPLNRIDLRRFWARRARRLLPALVVLLVAVAAWGHLAAPDATLDRLRGDGLAALAYVANWRYVLTGQSYFATFQAPSPLRHLWSLGVEEQWYLLWPLVLVVLARWTGRRGRAGLVVILVAGALGSAALMAALHDPTADPSRVYYGTDTRAQALLIGAALAAWRWWRPSRPSPAPPPAVVAAAGAGIGGLAWAVHVAGETSGWLYRGGFLAVALASVAVVALAADGRGRLASALGWAPLVWVGRRSYGLYLWHWPVVVAITETSTAWRGVTLTLARLAITVALAEVSFRFVEQPVRRRQWPTLPVAGIGVAAIAASVVLLLTLVTPPSARIAVATELRPASVAIDRAPAAITPRSASAPAAPALAVEAPAVEAPAVPAPAVVVAGGPAPTDPPPPPPLRVLLVGDSQAFVLGQAFAPGKAGPGIDVRSQAVLGCGVAPGDQECPTWRADWRSALDAVQPDVVVVLIGAWEMLDQHIDGKTVRLGTERWDRVVRTAVGEALDVASASGARVVLLDVPCYHAAPFVWGAYDTEQRNEAEREAVMNAIYADLASARAGVQVLDYAGLVCPEGRYTRLVQGIEARPDGVHLGEAGAAMTWAWLGPQLRAVTST